jgi:hypothetical protein
MHLIDCLHQNLSIFTVIVGDLADNNIFSLPSFLWLQLDSKVTAPIHSLQGIPMHIALIV